MSINLNPQKGFRDLYPSDKAKQEYVFEAMKKVARLYGFESYDGPLLEDIAVYLNKSSEELINRQTFQFKDKKDKTLILRPEMTPSLARMVARKANELTFPLRWYNFGLRYRYEAPQKGREREFNQLDCDIVGSKSIVADSEILAVAVALFLELGATKQDFVLILNSRLFMEQKLQEFGIDKNMTKQLFPIIDHKEKVEETVFVKQLQDLKLSSESIQKLVAFLTSEIKPDDCPFFQELFVYLKQYGIDTYCKINPNIVRGLDYYTGLVFEVKEIGGIRRSLLGGGRYDNLISTYNEKLQIPGVGFATSDVVLLEFLENKNLIPVLQSKPSKVLISVFSNETIEQSIAITQLLRNNYIPSELYPDTDKKLDKQLKYADKKGIPYVIILGPEEIKKNVIKLKNMKTGEQKETTTNELVNLLKNE
jgi:histidyl-tRNA synthetase